MPFLVGDNMKNLNYILFTLIISLFVVPVYADHIYKLDMDVYLDEFGDANITEKWDVQADGGSEWYKQVFTMGNQNISDFKVQKDGVDLEYNSSWDINASMSSKDGYYGINYVSEGLELCFGKSDYSRHTFTLTYTLSNAIFNTSDSQVLYETFFPEVTADSFYVKVRSFYEFPDTLDVWGYGYKGYAYVYDGYIEMSNEESTSLKGDRVVLLVKFPEKTFNTSNSYEQFPDFESVSKLAEKGAKKWHSKIKEIISKIFSAIASFFVPILIVIFALIGSKNTKYGTKKLKFGKDAKKIKDAPYFRDIPCNKDLFKGYWIACQYNLIKKQTDFLGAILLKWLKNGNIENVTVTTKILKKEERAIKFVKNDGLNEVENELYNMMVTASKDGTLESNEFTKWCKNNYKKILNWFDKAIDNVTDIYVNEGLITTEKKTFSSVYNVNDSMKETALQVAGLKNFLNEFSNIKDRESIEVNLWEEYLMFAQIFGIAKKVANEFKKLYPDVITEDVYNDVMFIHTISYEGVSAASTAKSRAESYSSGGGGFSSMGGGGGSFGGGGSMGGR